MNYNIYRNNDVVATVSANGSLTEKIFGEETLTMDFTLHSFVLFKIGDRINVYGKDYFIVQAPSVEKISTREYRYNLTFNGIKYRLSEVKYFFYDSENQLTVPEFSITGTATQMLEVLIANTERAEQYGWQLGTIDTTETKTIDFSDYNCLAALTRISEEFDVEFWIDADKTIHLENRTQSSGYRLEYGKSKGIKRLSRTPYTEASLVTRLYAKGGTKNLPQNYRNGQKHLRMAVPYLEKNTEYYGIVEHVQTFEDIYPKRVGRVTQVFENEPRMFADSTMDFDLNAYNEYGTLHLIAGTSAKVIFQTGDLAGYVLEVQKGGYNSDTKTFTLLKNKDEKAFEIPGPQFRPRVGDEYILVDIMMPETYITEAEAELQAQAQKYLDKNSKQRFLYAITPDPLYLESIHFNLNLGDTIHFIDSDFELDADIRVVSITRDINRPYHTTFEIAEQAAITKIVRNYIEREKKENIIRLEQRQNVERIAKSYREMQQLQDSIFDSGGYFRDEKINPKTIETLSVMVGDPLNQFDLFVTFKCEGAQMYNSGGQLIHYTIANQPRTWNITESVQLPSNVQSSYVYAKCQKNGNRGWIHYSTEKIKAKEDETYYFFKIGIVTDSNYYGMRRMQFTYGFTAINPGEITTGRITSRDGSQYIDIRQNEIVFNGKVNFSNGSPAGQALNNAVSTQIAGAKSELNNSIYSQIESAKSEINSNTDSRISGLKNDVKQSTEAFINQKILELSESAGNIDTAILDGVVTKAEAKSIEVSLENLKTGYQEKIAQVRKIIRGNAAGNYYSTFDPMEDLYTLFYGIFYKAKIYKSLTDEEKTEAINALNEYLVELDALRNAKIKVYTENIKNEQDKNTETARITREFSARKTEITNLKNTLNNYLSDNQISSAESNDFNTKLNRLSYLHTEFKTDVTTKTQNDTIVMNLKTIYEAFKRSFKNLYDYIVSAISDEKATETERQEIKNKFSDYREKTNALAQGVENLNWNYRKMAEVANNRAEKLENVTDFLTTTIDGDTISTGVLQVGGLTSDGQSQANAGVSGTVETENQTDVRFWAGSTYTNRKTAPFRMLENGELYSTAGEIGGFTIAEEYLRSGQEEAEHLTLSRSGIEFKSPNFESVVTLGANYVNAHAIPFLLSAKNTQTSSKAIGLSVNVPPNLYTPEHIKRLALDLTGNSEIRGAIYQLGTSAVFEKGYIGMAFNDTLKTHFKNTHSFVFTSIINSEVVVELPNKEDVRQATGITEVSFELKILLTKKATGGIILQGTGETKILDQDANPAFGNGKIGMGRGDSIILRYADGDYYVINLNR